MKQRHIGASVVIAAAALTLTATAQSHVSVLPTHVEAGAAQQLTIRVPNEGDQPTTKVAVQFPPAVTVYAFAQPVGGWTVTPHIAPDGSYRGVTYHGGTIPPAGYADFTVLATPFDTGTATFPTRQTYGTNTVKPWTGPPEKPGETQGESGPTDPGPAPAIEVVAAGATPATETPAASPATPGSRNDDVGSGAATWLGLIAVGFSVLALGGVGFLWSTRPARLPDDD